MARVTSENAKEFENLSGFEIFSLADDGDKDKVQFLLHNTEDVLAYTVHNIPCQNNRGVKYDRKVSCLKTSNNDPEGTCPLCDGGARVKIARYVPLYSFTHKKVMLFERGPQFIDSVLRGQFQRLISEGVDPINMVFEIERSGRKGDTNTSYQLYPLHNAEPIDASSLQVPDPEGSLIAVWSSDDMNNYLDTGNMPQTNATIAPVQRRDRSQAAPGNSYNQSGMDSYQQPYQPAAPNVNTVPPANTQTVSDPTQLF